MLHQLQNNQSKIRNIWILYVQYSKPLDSVCRPNRSDEKSEAIMRDEKWRAQSLSQKSKEAENQPSAFWEMISTHNKSMLVIINNRL